MLGKIKLKTATIALIAVILTFFSQGTLAYYSTVGKATNVVTSGNIQFIIHEKTDAGTDFPKEGVYIGYAETPKGSFPAIINFGARPTFEVAEKKIEAYLEGFSGDLYGETVRIYPTRYLRAIEKFPSAEALKEQLEKDKMSLKPAIK